MELAKSHFLASQSFLLHKKGKVAKIAQAFNLVDFYRFEHTNKDTKQAYVIGHTNTHKLTCVNRLPIGLCHHSNPQLTKSSPKKAKQGCPIFHVSSI